MILETCYDCEAAGNLLTLGLIMLTFEDIQNKITAALGILIISWGGYITAQTIDSPSKHDIERMIDRAEESSLYVQDRVAIQKSIQDLFSVVNKISTDQDRLREGITVNNDKIIINSQQIWAELSLLKIELEKIKLRLDYTDDKKKRIGESPGQPTSHRNPGHKELRWDRF